MKSVKIRIWQWILLVLVLLIAIDWFIQRPDAPVRALNDLIQSQGSPQLTTYPYRFRVLRVEGDTAVMTTPRNFSVPAFHFLGVIHPEIDVKNPNNPAFIAVQQTLGAVQSEASTIVLAQPGIKRITWELDEEWLHKHHINILK